MNTVGLLASDVVPKAPRVWMASPCGMFIRDNATLACCSIDIKVMHQVIYQAVSRTFIKYER